MRDWESEESSNTCMTHKVEYYWFHDEGGQTMQAFHNDPAIKQKYLDRVSAHQLADNLIKGVGWENGKGCAIGCTLESYSHSQYPIELGIPEMLAHLEDTIFEGLDNGEAQKWPERFLAAIEPGADLSTVGWKFLYWLLADSLIGAYDHEIVRDAVQQCATTLEPLTRGDKANVTAARSAAWSAESAAWSAARSAESAAWSAESAAWSAESAAWSAARSAESAAESAARSAARSAESAAESAARSAESAAESAARSAARSAAESAAYTKMADHLIYLLKQSNA